jgi:hypothetical protein
MKYVLYTFSRAVIGAAACTNPQSMITIQSHNLPHGVPVRFTAVRRDTRDASSISRATPRLRHGTRTERRTARHRTHGEPNSYLRCAEGSGANGVGICFSTFASTPGSRAPALSSLAKLASLVQLERLLPPLQRRLAPCKGDFGTTSAPVDVYPKRSSAACVAESNSTVRWLCSA